MILRWRSIRRFARDISTLPADLPLLLRNEGWRGVVAHLWKRTLRKVALWERFRVIEQDLRDLPALVVPDGVEIRVLGSEDWPALGDLVTRFALDRLQAGVARGWIGYGAWRGPRLVGYGWFSLRQDPEHDLVPFTVPGDTLLLQIRYVTPSERGSGIGRALTNVRLRDGRARGFERSVCLIAPRNHASYRSTAAAAAAGATRKRGVVIILRFLSWWRLLWRPER